MKKFTTLICFILCISLLAGCGANSRELPAKVEWNMSAAQVKQTIGEDKLKEGSSGDILNQMLTKDYVEFFGDRTASLAYVFNTNDQLAGITVQLFTNDGESIADAMKNTRAVMESIYGAGDGEGNTAHWHTKESVISMQAVEGAERFFIVLYQPITAHSH